MHLVGDVHPHGPENSRVALAEPEHKREARIGVKSLAFGDAHRNHVVGASEFHLIGDVDDEPDESDHMGRLRVFGAVSRHEGVVDIHLNAHMHALELDEYLLVGVFAVEREVLPVPERPALHLPVAAARRFIEKRFGVAPGVGNADIGIGRIVECGVFSVHRVRPDKFPGSFAQVDLDPVARFRRIGLCAAHNNGHEHDRQRQYCCSFVEHGNPPFLLKKSYKNVLT